MKKYKGFVIDVFNGNYIVAKDNEQIFPNDVFAPTTIKDCKDAINAYIKGDASKYEVFKI